MLNRPRPPPRGPKNYDGCITCRLRKKKCCPPTIPGDCDACRSLRIQCLQGYGLHVPSIYRSATVIQAIKAWVRKKANRRSSTALALDQLANSASVPTLPGATARRPPMGDHLTVPSRRLRTNSTSSRYSSSSGATSDYSSGSTYSDYSSPSDQDAGQQGGRNSPVSPHFPNDPPATLGQLQPRRASDAPAIHLSRPVPLPPSARVENLPSTPRALPVPPSHVPYSTTHQVATSSTPAPPVPLSGVYQYAFPESSVVITTTDTRHPSIPTPAQRNDQFPSLAGFSLMGPAESDQTWPGWHPASIPHNSPAQHTGAVTPSIPDSDHSPFLGRRPDATAHRQRNTNRYRYEVANPTQVHSAQYMSGAIYRIPSETYDTPATRNVPRVLESQVIMQNYESHGFPNVARSATAGPQANAQFVRNRSTHATDSMEYSVSFPVAHGPISGARYQNPTQPPNFYMTTTVSPPHPGEPSEGSPHFPGQTPQGLATPLIVTLSAPTPPPSGQPPADQIPYFFCD